MTTKKKAQAKKATTKKAATPGKIHYAGAGTDKPLCGADSTAAVDNKKEVSCGNCKKLLNKKALKARGEKAAKAGKSAAKSVVAGEKEHVKSAKKAAAKKTKTPPAKKAAAKPSKKKAAAPAPAPEVTLPPISLEGPIVQVNPSDIVRDWRAREDYGDLEGLAQSIRTEGQIQPIVIRKHPKKKDKFVIVAGLRRTRACKLLKKKVRAVIVDESNELRALDLQLAENLLRKNFDALEIGEGLKRRKAIYDKQHPEATLGGSGRGRTKAETNLTADRFTLATARQFGVSESKVKQMLGIADLPDEVKQEIQLAATTAERNAAARKALQAERKKRKEDKLRDQAAQKQAEREAAKDAEEQQKPDKKGKKDKAKGKATPKKKKGEETTAERIVSVHGDYQDKLDDLDRGSFDLILTDPPYNLERSEVSHKDRSSINEDVEWDLLDVSWVHHLAPFLDKGGTLIAFCPFEAIGLYKDVLSDAGLKYRGCLVWHKTNPGTAHRNTYLSSLEALVWATKGDKYTFVPFDNAGKVEAHNFLDGPICQGDERLDHPTQKPLWLMDRLVERHSAPGYRVLDPFAGVGSTLISAAQKERFAVGIEQEEKFFELLTLRVQAL